MSGLALPYSSNHAQLWTEALETMGQNKSSPHFLFSDILSHGWTVTETHHYDEGLGRIALSWSWEEIREPLFLLPPISNFPSRVFLRVGLQFIPALKDPIRVQRSREINRHYHTGFLVWSAQPTFKETYLAFPPPFFSENFTPIFL